MYSRRGISHTSWLASGTVGLVLFLLMNPNEKCLPINAHICKVNKLPCLKTNFGIFSKNTKASSNTALILDFYTNDNKMPPYLLRCHFIIVVPIIK